MPSDALLTQTALGTITSTTSTAGISLAKSAWDANNALYMRVIYSAASNASGSNSIVFSVDEQYDGSNWHVLSSAEPIALSTTAQSAELFIPFALTRQDLINASMSNAPKVRLTATFSGAGSGATITVASNEVVPAKL
jgi:hypothetical protein